MINYIEFLNVPAKVAIILVGLFLIMQVIGELLEFKGKVVPEFFKMRKHFSRKKTEREETSRTIKEVRQLLSDVNAHYSDDNIAKRNRWMNWVNERAELNHKAIIDITNNLSDVTQLLKDNTKLTKEMFIQSSRDRIIDFATKVTNESIPVSREEFYRIFKLYTNYEKFLEEHSMTNGEVDINYRIIQNAYEDRTRNHSFIEDIRGYTNKRKNEIE